jgi:hypothetical protein
MKSLALLLTMFTLSSCQSMRDSLQAGMINQNLDNTDAMLEYYARKAAQSNK